MNENFNPHLFSTDVDKCYESLVDAYSQEMMFFVPINKPRNNTGKKNPKWFNKDIKKLTNYKYKLHCLIRESPGNEHLKNKYKLVCKKIKKEIKQAIFDFETKLLSSSKNCPKLLFSYKNNQKSAKEVIRSLVDESGMITSDGAMITNILNEQFCRVFNRPVCGGLPYMEPLIGNYCTLNINVFSTKNLLVLIDKMNAHKSAGNDCIHPYLIKQCAFAFASLLAQLFKNSFVSGQVPQSWKIANVTPIFKSGNKIDPNNYRPISLTCKMMENDGENNS